MAEGDVSNPFVDRMRQLESRAMDNIEGSHEQNVQKLQESNVQRVKELGEQNDQRIALIERTREIIMKDALDALNTLSPEMLGDAGEASFASEAFAWCGEEGVSSLRVPGDLVVATGQYLSYYRTPINQKVWEIGARGIFGATAEINEVQFLPDGRLFCDGTWGGQPVGRFITSVGLEEKNEKGLVFGRDLNVMAYFREDGVHIVQGDASGDYSSPHVLKATKNVKLMALSPHETTLCTFDEGGNTFRLWSIRTKECFKEFKLEGGKVQKMNFSPDGNFILAVRKMDIVRIDPLKSTYTIHTICLDTGEEEITSASFHPSRPLLALGIKGIYSSSGGSVKFWDTKEHTFETISFERGPEAMDFSPDGSTLAVGSLGEGIFLLDLESKIRTKLNDSPKAKIRSLKFNPLGYHKLEGFDTMMEEVQRMIEESGLTLSTKNHIDFTLKWDRRIQL
jgi:WD40 repeat protein